MVLFVYDITKGKVLCMLSVHNIVSTESVCVCVCMRLYLTALDPLKQVVLQLRACL